MNLANRIGRITTAGAIEEFAIPTANAGPWGIALGADGSMWVAERTASRIARIGTGSGAQVAVSVKGQAKVGQALTCSAAATSGPPVVRTSYAWSRDGKPITGAARATYRPTARDVGSSVTCSAAITTGPGLLQLAARSKPIRVSR